MTCIQRSRGLSGVSESGSLFVALSFLVSFTTVGGLSTQQNADPGHQPVVSWHGLLTEDAEAASSFYANLFGWGIQNTSEGKYLVTHNGALIGGFTQIEHSTSGVDESTWLLGISVPDVRAALAEALRLGARSLVEVSNAQGLGEWVVIEDPQASLRFYSAVAGWEGGTWERPDGPYPVFLSNGELSAGVVSIEKGDWRPGWAPYVGVADLSSTLARATELGGEVLFEPDAEIDEGLVAAIVDPTGVGFMVYQLPEKSR